MQTVESGCRRLSGIKCVELEVKDGGIRTGPEGKEGRSCAVGTGTGRETGPTVRAAVLGVGAGRLVAQAWKVLGGWVYREC